jgi:hypothetical protein
MFNRFIDDGAAEWHLRARLATGKKGPTMSKQSIPEQGPVLNGHIYCSSWCGGDCTKADYDRAVKGAQELADQLGEPWAPRVWENLGWHYAASAGESDVNPKTDGTYWASIMVGVEDVGRVNCQQVIGDGETPIEAVMDAVRKMERARNNLNEAIRKFRGA